ncbi:xanthine dehydrogenase family protein molybdopterin-binding subunit [Lichenibacterium dinghuense]|uniref:xanthine dehydrogenase family protein molybdopterin-binding subunit n=1 Tax=Lichenibacterium dinghuense TaxID=2895977 RepID=UPI00281616EB|nr:xanthine dehydrogenase family protein molybdopterin-binding subunit [Lichenibacterium sp. 6Y81]
MDMTHPIGVTPLDTIQDGVVGQPLDRVDGPPKVTGTATYAYEYKEPTGIAYGYLVPSAIAKGRIASLDTAVASSMPGVVAVLTYRNAPKQGKESQQVSPELVDDRITHYGQAVACVVADTFEQARAAAYAVEVGYAPDPVNAVLGGNLDRAVKPKDRGTTPPDTSSGDAGAAYATAPVKVEVQYTTPLQTHAMMEPHATLAYWRRGQLILFTANQMLNRGQAILASVLDMPKDNIRLVSRYVGGGFGAKLTPHSDAVLAALASKVADRPVKLALTRQQVFHSTFHRSDTIQRIRLGATPDGKLVSVSHDSWSGNAPGQENFEAAAEVTRSLYATPNIATEHRLASLDVPVASAMRAPGEAVGMLAIECAMDELAEKLAMDPIELRALNDATIDPTKHIPYSTRAMVPCLRKGAEMFGWNKRNAVPASVRDGNWMVGMGVAAASRGNPLQPAKAWVRIGPDGVATTRAAMTDIGTGTYTILTQIAAELLGLPPDMVRTELGDTEFPMSSGSGGSFGAGSAGSALYDACMTMRQKLALAAGMSGDGVAFRDGRVTQGNRSVTLASLAGPAGIEATGGIQVGDMHKMFSQQSYGAHFAEVGVDADTGEIRLRRMLGVFTAGRILNVKTARSQAIGGMVFGVGAALMEAVELDPRYGMFVNNNLAEYHVPVHADITAVDAVFLPELDDKSNPLKSKGIGELGICGAGAAVANAVYNATGIRIRDYPLTLDKVLAGFEARERGERRSAVPSAVEGG